MLFMKLCGFIGVLLPLALCSQIQAEMWSCRNAARRSVLYTESPSSSEADGCTQSTIAKASYNKLPFDGFLPRGTPRGDESTGQPTENNSASEASSARASLRMSDSQAEPSRPEVIWEASEERPKKKGGKLRGSRVQCLIQGSARSEERGAATITVTRGALTKTAKKIVLSGGAKNFRMILDGACRNPEVSIEQP